MSLLYSQIQYFSSELLNMLDAGAKISIDDFIDMMDNGSIINYVHQNCPHKNINFSPENANELKSALAEFDVREGRAYEKCIENNGLVYLVDCLMEILQHELFILSTSEVV